jgi:leucine dehydrogenase
MDIGDLAAQDFEQIQVLRDDEGAVLAFLAIHSTRLGPAFGGIRRWTYRNPAAALTDALRLAEAMTWKCALAGVGGGGGKTVIVQTQDTDREAAYRLVGRHVEEMGGRYFTGPDVGTEPADLEIVAEHTDFVARPDRAGNLAEPTAVGGFAGIRAVGARLGFDGVRRAHVLVQGLGEVGSRLVELLVGGGARVTVCDVRRELAERLAARLEVAVVDPGELLSVSADVFAPCALGGVVHDLSLENLRVRAVAGSANNVLASPDHGASLFARGILYAPDFVINSGALIHGALLQLEGRAPPRARIEEIGRRVGEILDAARTQGIPPEVVALRMARDRVGAALGGPFFPRDRKPR